RADEGAELGGKGRVAEVDAGGGVLLVAFVRAEEVQLVLDQRSADADAGLVSLVGVVRRQRRELEVLRRRRDPLLRLIEDERGAGEIVAARLRHGGDDCARGAAVLRAVVLRDDAELLYGILGEGIAAAGVLPDRAALQDV